MKTDGLVPEHWLCERLGESVAVLNIPASLSRDRVFDVDVSLQVKVPEDELAQAWHGLSLEVDGKSQWTRRIASNCPGQTDGLDYHCKIVLKCGRGMRIRAMASVQASVVVRLVVEATQALA